MTPLLKGSILVLISAVGYGLMPLFSRAAYAEGVSVNTLLFYRFLVASILLWAMYYFSGPKTTAPTKHKLYLAALGAVGYFLPSVTLFIAYERLHSSVATLILFIHPIFVVFFETLLFKTKLTLSKGISVLLTAVGLWIVLAKPDIKIDNLGLILSFAAAITYSIYCLGLYEKRTQKTNTLYVTAFVLSTCCLMNFIYLLPNPSSFLLPNPNALFAVLSLAIVGTLIPAIAFNAGLKLVGPGSATIISTVEPIIVALAGTFILKEVFTQKLLIGGLIILVAITLIQFQPAKQNIH
jgi:drug/metabolite transporter (DMT)-like permease